MSNVVIAETLNTVTSLDLREAASAALAAGQSVERYAAKSSRGQLVETLVVDEEQAGQAAGGNASWGDWDEVHPALRLDGSGELVGLDGAVT